LQLSWRIETDIFASVVRKKNAHRRELTRNIVIVVEGDAKLLKVLAALHPAGRFARTLNGRHEEGNEDRDDSNDDEKLDQREA